MTSYQSKYTTDAVQEDLEDRFATDIETKHVELFGKLRMAGEGKLDHRDAPWNTEHHRELRYTAEDESRYEHHLDPASAAGKIFNSFSELRSEATYQEVHTAALRFANDMAAPVEHAISEFHNPDALPKDSIPSMTEEIGTRMTGVHNEIYAAIWCDDEDEFMEAVTNLQHLSTDAHLLKTIPGYNPSFIDSLRELDAELADELRVIKTQDGNDPSPKWMSNDHASQSKDEIYDTINNHEIRHDGTRYSTAAYYRTVATEIAEHISQPVLNQINAFKNETMESEQNDPTHPTNPFLEDYLIGRLNSIESIIDYSLRQRDRDIYNQAMENLIRLNGEAELIRAGEVPQEDWHDGTRYNHDNLEPLAKARDVAEANKPARTE